MALAFVLVLAAVCLYSEHKRLNFSSSTGRTRSTPRGSNATPNTTLRQPQRDFGNETATDKGQDERWSNVVNDIAYSTGTGNASTLRQEPLQEAIDQWFDSLLVSTRSEDATTNSTQWIRDYVQWHAATRARYPDTQLLFKNNNDEDAPKVLIAYHDQNKHGLTDRVRALGHLLHFCSQPPRRVLLIKWYEAPMDLETFLMPTTYFNWTLPILPARTSTSEKLTKRYPNCFKNKKNKRIGKRDRICQTDDSIKHLGSFKQPFGVIWHSLFRPSPLVQHGLDQTYHELHLIAGHYHAIHCRVRHPAHYNKWKPFASKADKEAELNGLLTFEGKTQDRALQTAVHAIQCSNWLVQQQQNHDGTTEENLPSYFYSDSPELVQAVLDSQTTTTTQTNNSLEQDLGQLAMASQIVARRPTADLNNATKIFAHIAGANFAAMDYSHTFVDLYLAVNAKCVSMGVGRFSYLAAKISGSKCWTRHESPPGGTASVTRWDMAQMFEEVPQCPIIAK
jgi:hypothetical protein